MYMDELVVAVYAPAKEATKGRRCISSGVGMQTICSTLLRICLTAAMGDLCMSEPGVGVMQISSQIRY